MKRYSVLPTVHCNLRAVRCIWVDCMKCCICMSFPEISDCTVQNTFHDGNERLRTEAPKNPVVYLLKISCHYVVPCTIRRATRTTSRWLDLNPIGEALDVPQGPPHHTGRVKLRQWYKAFRLCHPRNGWTLVPLDNVSPGVLL